jgi:uncharacterized protein YndB with AHSA1/START domain
VTNRSIVHASFTITRVYDAAPSRVFQAFADEEAKNKWFGGGSGWQLLKRSFDFREGGREYLSGRHESGTVHTFDCLYHDIVENERIIYTYVMELDGKRISVSQAAIELRPESSDSNPTGTKLVLTEYGDYLDGYDNAGRREHGTAELLDKLGKTLA